MRLFWIVIFITFIGCFSENTNQDIKFKMEGRWLLMKEMHNGMIMNRNVSLVVEFRNNGAAYLSTSSNDSIDSFNWDLEGKNALLMINGSTNGLMTNGNYIVKLDSNSLLLEKKQTNRLILGFDRLN